MPPKGYKKGYIKDSDTNQWIDPRTLVVPQEKEKKKKVKKIKPVVKDELGPTTKVVKDPFEYPTVIISWKDSKKRSRTTQYTMAELSINEAISEIFFGAKKETRIGLTLDGVVLEKN